ncbi:MAG: hypothetical protein JWQ16_2232 [Novosphingobium sp.]|nr:hypothetical protein [Novosphingobium sp.]
MALKKLRGVLERSLAALAVPVSGSVKPYGDDGEAAALVVHVVDSTGDGAEGTSFAAPLFITLNSGQAAGTTPILAANPSRKALMINPPVDCQLLIAPATGGTRGRPQYGDIGNDVVGRACPTNALYLYGPTLGAGAVVAIWEG